MHRPFLPAALAAAMLALAAPTAMAGEPVMPLSDVRAGMTCDAISVVQGTEPVSFGAEVISVEGGPRPSDALIIMRFSGEPIAQSGIGQGFSGSPVRCQDAAGTWRVIGAISQGLGQYDNFVAGVTPIEAMLATPTWADGPAIPTLGVAAPAPAATPARLTAVKASAKAKTTKKTKKTKTSKSKSKSKKSKPKTTKPKTTPASDPITLAAAWRTRKPMLTMRGPRGALATSIERSAAKAGIPLVVAPTATRQQAASVPLKGGDAVSASIVTGDVSLGAIGTVTYVDGDKVWAFGHPFAGTGPSRLLMERASISTVISSPAVGSQVSFKLGSPIAPAGTVGFDGTAAIGGVLGATPGTIPLRATIRNAAGATIQSATANVVDERAVRGGLGASYIAVAAGANAGTALQRLATSDFVGGSARACIKIMLKGETRPLNQCIDSIVPSPTSGGVESAVQSAVSSSVGPALSAERFTRLIDAVDVDVTYRPEADTASIVRLRQPKNVKAGSTITVKVVVVQGSTGERREVPIKVKIPRSAAGERTAIVVLSSGLGGSVSAGGGGGSDFVEIIFGGDEVVAPKSLPALRSLYTKDGISGLRAMVVPGIPGDSLLRALTEDDGGGLSDDEYFALVDGLKIVQETPSVYLDGAVAATVRPRR